MIKVFVNNTWADDSSELRYSSGDSVMKGVKVKLITLLNPAVLWLATLEQSAPAKF